MRRAIPDACVERLSLYVRELARLQGDDVPFVSSRRLAQHLGLTDAQVRRDISYFGQFGTSGRGYAVGRLRTALNDVLGLNGRTWSAVLVGVGNLGSALLAYRGFRERSITFRVAVDADPRVIGRTIAGLTVAPASRLGVLMREHHASIGVIAVPAEAAQAVCDQLIAGGARALVNFAPARLDAPAHIRLRNVDLAVELEMMAFYLSGSNGTAT
jgi:redox-sensing transcriptional repressor